MSKLLKSVLIATVISSVAIAPAWADRYGYHGGDARGWWGPALFFGTVLAIAATVPPPVYYPSPVYTAPTPAPQTYVQQPVVVAQTAPQPVRQDYWWYFCGKPAGYYPYVTACPTGWTRVSPVPPDIH